MAVEASTPMFCSDAPERMTGGGVFLDGFNRPFQPQQMMAVGTDSLAPPPTAAFSSSSSPPNPPLAVDSSYYYLAALVEKQNHEMDQYHLLQVNRLRAALQQQWKQHAASLMTLEWKASLLLRQKDDELARARQRAAELEACVRSAEQEREAWQRIAAEKESVALSLRDALDRVTQPCFSSTGGAAAGPEEEEGENAASCSGHYKEEEEEEGFAGSRCPPGGSGGSCMLLLPCRHLCSFQTREACLEACPFCRSVIRGCTEVFLG